jgi:hypothetical protein
MNDQLIYLSTFWISLALSATYGVLFYLSLRRRKSWLRLLDAEESFWARFGLPKGDFTRRWAESRKGTITKAVMSLSFLLLAILSVYVYFRSLPRT